MMSVQTLEPIVFPSTRRWPYVVLGLALGAAAVVGADIVVDSSDAPASEAGGLELDLATAPVEIRDLIEEVDWVADLGYGTAVDVRAAADGIVTATASIGTVLRRGDIVLEIDERPVSVFYGAVPAWRDLAEGDEGVDVAQLETNLVALGYDPDGLVTIDEEFTSRTEVLVEQWQEDLGLDITGVFSTDSVLVVDGPVSVTTAPSVGDPSQSGAVLGSVSARAVTTTIVATQPGQITALAPVGTAIEHGTILYVADGVEVRAITAFETVDGLADDGTVREYVLVPEGHQVTAQLVAPDESLTTTRPTLELSTQTLSVVVPVGLADQGDWIAGQTVQIELPDETVVGGEVIDVGTVAQDGGQGVDPTVEVIVEITELVADDLPASEVVVTVAGESILDAMVVPTRALVTLSEGGFAVEKVLDDATTVLVAVETGAFDDGVVEVTSSQLAPGDDVVVPQ